MKVVDLRRQMPGSPVSSNGQARKDRAPTIHYTGGHPIGQNKIAAAKSFAQYHMRPGVFEPKRQNGIQYARMVWGDTVYILRNLDSITWHCGHMIGNKHSPSIMVPIGGSQRATRQTIETLAELVKWLNRKNGTRGVFGHQHWKATACPGPLMGDFVNPFRAGKFASIEVGGANAGKPNKPKPPERAPEKKTWYRRVNFLASGPKNEAVARAAARALNNVARRREMDEMFARHVTRNADIRYISSVSAKAKKGQVISVVVGSQAKRHLADSVRTVGALEDTDILDAAGRSMKHTKEKTAWRLVSICDELGFGQAEKDRVLANFKRNT